MHGDYLYFLALLSPADVATMIALVAVMLIFNRNERVTMREAFHVMLGVVFVVAIWTTFARGAGFVPWIRYVGIYVICGVCLYQGENFTLPAALVGAAVLLVANVGCTELMGQPTARR